MHGSRVGTVSGFIGMDAVQPGAARRLAIGVGIGQRRAIAGGVPLLAVDDTGLAADTDVEINDQPQLDRGRFRQHGHDASPFFPFVHSIP